MRFARRTFEDRSGEVRYMTPTGVLDRFDTIVGRFTSLTESVLRGGLGVVILLAGGHKLIAPAVWHAYLAPPFVNVWPTAILPLDPTFVLFGISEVVFGVLLLADWHTPTVASVTALSLAGVVVNLSLGVAFGDPYVDVLIRDLGLTLFAFGVALHTAPS